MKKPGSFLLNLLIFITAIAVVHAINNRGRTDCSLVTYEKICESGPLILSGGVLSCDGEREIYTLSFSPGGEVYVMFPRSVNYEISGVSFTPFDVNMGSFVALHPDASETVSIKIISDSGRLSAAETYVYAGTYSQLSDFYYNNHFLLGLCVTVMLTSAILFFRKKSEKYFLWLIALAFFVGRYAALGEILSILGVDVYVGGDSYMILNEVVVSIITYFVCREFMPVKIGKIPFVVFSTAAAVPALALSGTNEYFWYGAIFFYAVLYRMYGICFEKIPASDSLEKYTFMFAWMSTVSLRFVEIFCEMGILPSGDVNLRYRIRGITAVIFVVALFICAIKRFAERFERSDRLNAELEKKIREKSLENISFIRSMLHNLKTPLFSVSGYTDMALRIIDKNPGAAKQYIGKANEKAIYAGHLMDTLSLAMRVGTGQLQLNRVPLDLAETAKKCAETASPAAAAKKISVSCSLDEPMPLEGDPMYLQQALENIIDNAIINTPENGKVEIFAEKSPDAQKRILHIRDNGCGIEESEKDRVFEAYYSKRSEGASSSGLGLYITKEIINLHGGEISVESSPGAGADFIISLPSANQSLSM